MKKLLVILMAIFILPACSEKIENTVDLIFAIFSIVLGLIFFYYENKHQNNKYNENN